MKTNRHVDVEPRIATGEVAKGFVRVKANRTFWTAKGKVWPTEVVDLPVEEFAAVKNWVTKV